MMTPVCTTFMPYIPTTSPSCCARVYQTRVSSDSGTATHFLAEQCLSTNTHPATFIGRTIVVGASVDNGFDGARWEDQPVLSGWTPRFSCVIDD